MPKIHDKITIYDFQAEGYVFQTEANIKLLRKYSDRAANTVADNLEKDLYHFKKAMGLEKGELKHAS